MMAYGTSMDEFMVSTLHFCQIPQVQLTLFARGRRVNILLTSPKIFLPDKSIFKMILIRFGLPLTSISDERSPLLSQMSIDQLIKLIRGSYYSIPCFFSVNNPNFLSHEKVFTSLNTSSITRFVELNFWLPWRTFCLPPSQVVPWTCTKL